MPCLNEAETIAICIQKAQGFLQQSGIVGEVIIADNGSSDGSQEIARKAGAKVVSVSEKGYGAALIGGIRTASGQYVIMGDADDSYDFSRLQNFVDKLREGNLLVMGNRFQGGIAKGAMPALHRYFGNPVLSGIGRLLYRSPIGDFHCGLRGFNREALLALDLRASGMEFASEMIVKATLQGWPVAEVPTTLSPDGRSRPPHLRSWRDGWRHLRFLLLLSPRWLFLYPGLILLGLGLLLMAWLLPAARPLGSVMLDIHTLLYAAIMTLLGVQASGFALCASYYAVQQGLLPRQDSLYRWAKLFSLERGLVLALVLISGGLLASVWAVWNWRSEDFGDLSPSIMMRLIIPAVTAITAGFQILFMSFFMTLLIHRDR